MATVSNPQLRSDGVYRSGPFQALNHAFSIQCIDPELLAYLSRILASLAAPRRPTGLYRIEATRHRGYRLSYEGEQFAIAPAEEWVASALLWHVNRQAVRSLPGTALLHAAAVEYSGLGVLLPAPSGHGKTTLAAGLLQGEGFRYLTDEAVAIERHTLRMCPYPKPLSVDPGSWAALEGLRPSKEDSRFSSRKWQVPPTAFGSSNVAPPVWPSILIVPRYVRGGVTRFREMTAGEALLALFGCTFQPQIGVAPVLRILSQVVERCNRYELIMGNLGKACELVRGAITHGEK